MQKNTIISIIISIAFVGGTLYFISDRSSSSGGEVAQSQNVEIRDGIQYVTVTAQGGYSPRVTEIKGGLPTKLIVKTDATTDRRRDHRFRYSKIWRQSAGSVWDGDV